MNITFKESLYSNFSLNLEITEVLHQCQTNYQKMIIFKNPKFGRVLALDGIIQTTEKDEYIYHEMFVHQPLLSLSSPRNVLIIGGGDGGILREVMKYPSIETVTMVEIDPTVIQLCREYMPFMSNGSFDDSRLTLLVQDAMDFIRVCQESFDVILSDTSDPVGPNEALFSKDFYHHCQRCLTPQGIFVAQNGVSFCQLDQIVGSYNLLKHYFEQPTFYRADIPSYIGGSMCFSWAQNDQSISSSFDEISDRYDAIGLKSKTRYYDPEQYIAAQVLPRYIRDLLNTK